MSLHTTPIHTVLFDYGGVLAEEGFRGGLHAIARLNGHNAEAFYEQACRTIADCGYLTGDSDEASFWRGMRRAYALPQTDGQLRGEILRRFVLRPGMLAAAARLRRRGLRVGVISDQTDWLDELGRRDEFFPLFDVVLNSYHLHASKHRGDLFAVAACRLRAAPAEILIIDDNAGNIEKARQQGFGVLLFEDEQDFLQKIRALFPEIF